MGSNGDTNSPKALEERVRSMQQMQKNIGHNDDESMLLQKNSDDEQLDLHASVRPEHGKISSYPEQSMSKNEHSDADFSQRGDNHKTDSTIVDMECFDEQHYRKSELHQSTSSVISQRTDSSVNPSPQTRRGLDHCITAPAGSRHSMLLESQEKVITRSMTDKRDTARLDMKLDRLSEIEKRNLIVNLVKIQNDGTVEVDLSNNTTVASELLELQSAEGPPIIDSISTRFNKSVPKLKIVMLVVGTRGDVQPFLAIAKRLQEFGHHVRLATHVNFSTFVKSAGVDFYPLAGDPRVLAGYMARNKGFIPSAPGEISIQRKHLKTIIESLLPACTGPDIETGQPFRAQAIIANPPAYGHVHVAESLGVPIHIFFTMPWTPTHEFPHPLARVPQSAGYWLSYILVDLIIWWSIRGYINDFRRRKLKLAPIAYFSLYHGSLSHLPTAYMWSPHLVPKPSG